MDSGDVFFYQSIFCLLLQPDIFANGKPNGQAKRMLPARTDLQMSEPSEKFDELRKDAPATNILMYSMKQEYIDEAFNRPGVIVGSDGMPWIVEGDEKGFNATFDTPYGAGNGHARGAGTHARILRMVREGGAVSLMDAISKMTYEPAAFLEDHVPQIKLRGRVQEGSAADITIFDPETVTDNATPKIGENSLASNKASYSLSCCR